MGMGFQFEQHRLGLWDLSWDLKKTISWEMGLGPPPLHDPLLTHFGCLVCFDLGPSYMVSGTRDNPPPEASLSNIYI